MTVYKRTGIMTKLTDKIYTREEVEQNKDEFKWSDDYYALVDDEGKELCFANFEDATHFYENSSMISIVQNLAGAIKSLLVVQS